MEGTDGELAEKAFLSLFSSVETAVYKQCSLINARLYQALSARDPVHREHETKRCYNGMMASLLRIQESNNPALMLGTEYALLLRDQKHLRKLAKRQGVDRFLKADITGNQNGLEAVAAALKALLFQSTHNTAYHYIMDLGTSRKCFDARHLVKDVVRDAANSQAARLRLDMRGLNQTEMDRKKCAFLGRRHENMTACETVYKKLQASAKKTWTADRPSFDSAMWM